MVIPRPEEPIWKRSDRFARHGTTVGLSVGVEVSSIGNGGRSEDVKVLLRPRGTDSTQDAPVNPVCANDPLASCDLVRGC